MPSKRLPRKKPAFELLNLNITQLLSANIYMTSRSIERDIARTASISGKRKRLLGEEHCGISFYNIWKQMIGRTTKPHDASYYNYGARGIKCCPQWLPDYKIEINGFTYDGFDVYTMDMLPDYLKMFKKFKDLGWDTTSKTYRPSLDRKDNSKGYSPENCEWTSMALQNGNKRYNIPTRKGVEDVIRNAGGKLKKRVLMSEGKHFSMERDLVEVKIIKTYVDKFFGFGNNGFNGDNRARVVSGEGRTAVKEEINRELSNKGLNMSIPNIEKYLRVLGINSNNGEIVPNKRSPWKNRMEFLYTIYKEYINVALPVGVERELKIGIVKLYLSGPMGRSKELVNTLMITHPGVDEYKLANVKISVLNKMKDSLLSVTRGQAVETIDLMGEYSGEVITQAVVDVVMINIEDIVANRKDLVVKESELRNHLEENYTKN